MVFSEKEKGVIYFEDNQSWYIIGYGLLGGDDYGISQGIDSTADGYGCTEGKGNGYGSGCGSHWELQFEKIL